MTMAFSLDIGIEPFSLEGHTHVLWELFLQNEASVSGAAHFLPVLCLKCMCPEAGPTFRLWEAAKDNGSHYIVWGVSYIALTAEGSFPMPCAQDFVRLIFL